MQFHLDGFQVGDPRVRPAHPAAADRPAAIARRSRRADRRLRSGGIVLAAQLAEFPASRRASSSAGLARSSSVRPMVSPVARSRCSRRSGSASDSSPRPTG